MIVPILLFVLLVLLLGPIVLVAALVALLVYPLVWLLLLPFRVLGIAVGGVLDTLRAVIGLPARLLGHRPTR